MSQNPPAAPHRELPADAYRDMTRILRIGLITALVILLGGIAAYLVENASIGFGQMVAQNPIVHYLGLDALAHGLATGQPEAYLTLGVLVLVATPIARVVTGLYFFARNREREMALIATTVGVLLFVGILVIGPFLR